MGIDCSPDELYSEYWIHHRRIPAVLLALVQLGLGGAIWTLGSFMLINNILGNFVEPRIMGKGLGLSTLVVFLSLLFFGDLYLEWWECPVSSYYHDNKNHPGTE